jgi:hypothetical protein
MPTLTSKRGLSIARTLQDLRTRVMVLICEIAPACSRGKFRDPSGILKNHTQGKSYKQDRQDFNDICGGFLETARRMAGIWLRHPVRRSERHRDLRWKSLVVPPTAGSSFRLAGDSGRPSPTSGVGGAVLEVVVGFQGSLEPVTVDWLRGGPSLRGDAGGGSAAGLIRLTQRTTPPGGCKAAKDDCSSRLSRRRITGREAALARDWFRRRCEAGGRGVARGPQHPSWPEPRRDRP